VALLCFRDQRVQAAASRYAHSVRSAHTPVREPKTSSPVRGGKSIEVGLDPVGAGKLRARLEARRDERTGPRPPRSRKRLEAAQFF
jgi:hypothetical protein